MKLSKQIVLVNFVFLLTLIFTFNVRSEGAAEPAFKEGEHYLAINPAQPTQTTDKIEVVEVFSYACPHCNHFEPYIKAWKAKLPENVEFRRIAAVFRDSWLPLAKAYFTAEAMGLSDKLDTAIFKAVHEEQRKLEDEKAVTALFVENGVKEQDFKSTYNSFAIDGKVRQASDIIPKYGVDGVPAMAVNGKYLVTGSLAGDFENMLKVVDFLITKEASSVADKQ